MAKEWSEEHNKFEVLILDCDLEWGVLEKQVLSMGFPPCNLKDLLQLAWYQDTTAHLQMWCPCLNGSAIAFKCTVHTCSLFIFLVYQFVLVTLAYLIGHSRILFTLLYMLAFIQADRVQ